MADTFDSKTRSWIMAQVHSRGTRPERVVRQALREAGCRLSSHAKSLPGNPDFVIREIRLAVFVNGCFWHWHGCPRSRMPATNRAYWQSKIARNVRRDRRSKRSLTAAGWHYWTIWECRLSSNIARLLGRIEALRARQRSEEG